MIKIQVFISKQDNKLKIEYSENNTKKIRLFELINNQILETIFNENGAIIQTLFLKNNTIDSATNIFFNSLNEKIERSEETFEEIKLKKLCPKCTSDSLNRFINQSKKEIPIVPIYICNNCNEKSYYLTQEYLEYLVLNNKNLFEKTELDQLNTNKNEFLNELSEYINRILASKKISRIK